MPIDTYMTIAIVKDNIRPVLQHLCTSHSGHCYLTLLANNLMMMKMMTVMEVVVDDDAIAQGRLICTPPS